MRILFATNLVRRDGSNALASFLSDQVEGLRSRGCAVTVRAVEQHGPRGWYRFFQILRRSVLDEPPDVVHVQGGGGTGLLAAWATATRPVVLTLHGSDALGLRRLDARRPLVSLQLAVNVLLSQIAASRATAIVAVSDNVRRALWRSVDRQRAQVIPCGVDFARFTPQDRRAARRRLALPLDRRLILFVDPHRPGKRFTLARRAIELLKNRLDDVELVKMSNVPREGVPTYLHAADLLLITSSSEGSPVITKEALAANLSVVSVDVGDLREQLKEASGCCVTGHRPEELAAAMEKVLCGDAGVCDAKNRRGSHAIEHTCTQLIKVYEQFAR